MCLSVCLWPYVKTKMTEVEACIATYLCFVHGYRPSGQAANERIKRVMVEVASGILKGH